MRLIDAEALEEEDFTDFFIDVRDAKVFEDIIERTPAIEAKPVVHAHWEIEYDDDDNIKKCYCSNCGVGCEPMNYCGFCGAQMDEGVKIPVLSMEDVPKLMKD